MRFYRAYELTFAAEIALPELPEALSTATPDVFIRFGYVPQHLPHPIFEGDGFHLTEERFRFEVEEVASFQVTRGQTITIQPSPQSSAADVRSFVLGTCLGVLLHQRAILPIHASAIVTDRGAVLFMGDRGSGKSTLLQTFLQRGYQMLTDDIAGVILDDAGRPVILPGIPQTKLRKDAARFFNHPTTALPARPVVDSSQSQIESLQDKHPIVDVDKYHVAHRGRYCKMPQSIWRVYWLPSPSTGEQGIQPLSTQRAFEMVLNNIYRRPMMVLQQQREANFKQLSGLVNALAIRRLNRPLSLTQIPAFADLVENDFRAGAHQKVER